MAVIVFMDSWASGYMGTVVIKKDEYGVWGGMPHLECD